MIEIKRIPYDNWINSQMSIARFYGGININGKYYVLDYDNCPTKVVDGEIKYFPDLIPFSEVKKKAKAKTNKITQQGINNALQELFK